MTVRVTFDTDNAAFADPLEAARIFWELAGAVELDGGIDAREWFANGPIQDANGNTIGRVDIEE